MHFQFSNWHNFFHMGGYAAYVWSAYGFVGSLLLSQGWRAKRKLKKQLAAIQLLQDGSHQ